MAEEVLIRERKSVKHGKTYEYRFEIASIDGNRKWSSKGGFLSEQEARKAGIHALKKYRLCGLPERTASMSYADFLDEWMENECKYNLKETTLLNYRKRIKNHIKSELGAYQIGRISREKLQKFLQKKYDDGYSKNTLSTLRGILSKSMTYAAENGIIQASPAGNLKIPRCEMTTVPTRSEPHSYLCKDKMVQIFERFPEGSPSYVPMMIGYRSLNATLRKALNRERTNVGRTAYSDRIRAILSSAESEAVLSVFTANLTQMSNGKQADELKWVDVQAHAVRHLNARKETVFVTPDLSKSSPKQLLTILIITTTEEYSQKQNGCLPLNSGKHP